MISPQLSERMSTGHYTSETHRSSLVQLFVSVCSLKWWSVWSIESVQQINAHNEQAWVLCVCLWFLTACACSHSLSTKHAIFNSTLSPHRHTPAAAHAANRRTMQEEEDGNDEEARRHVLKAWFFDSILPFQTNISVITWPPSSR